MEQLLTRVLEKPSLELAQLAGTAVRGQAGQDPRRAFSALSAWSSHVSPWVRIASAVGFGHFATMDRASLGSVVPFLKRLAADPEADVRRHGAQAALQQLWLAHADAVESLAEDWARSRNDSVREVVVRSVAEIAVGGQIRRPSVLRRFIERGLALYDIAAHDASPQVRCVIAEAVDEIGALAPNLVTPQVCEWSRREDVGALRLVAEIARLPAASRYEGVDFAAAADSLRRQQASHRIRAARWVRQGRGSLQVPQVMAKRFLRPSEEPCVPWAHAADPYRGCEMRCEFCSSRSISEWAGDDPESFTRRVTLVRNAPDLLASELAAGALQPREKNVIGIGIRSDPYQSVEERAEVVRDLLKVCLEAGHPVVVQTRQSLVLRDLDLYETLADRGLVNVLVAMQSPIEGIRTKSEIGCSTVAERFRTIGMLARKDVPVGLLLSPVMPDLTDDPALIDETMRRAAEAGAKWAIVEPLHLRGSAGVKVRLFLEAYVKPLVPRYEQLYGASPHGESADAEWVRRLVAETVPEIRARHGLDDTSRMISGGRDPASLLVRV